MSDNRKRKAEDSLDRTSSLVAYRSQGVGSFLRTSLGSGINQGKDKNMKKSLLFVAAILAFTCAVQAQVLTGSVTASVPPGEGEYGGGATSSSLGLFVTNVISATTGDFVGAVPTDGILTPYLGTINGLSTTPLADSINNYFVFSTRPPYGGTGTTPPNRFDFDLATITEDSYNSGTGAAVFTGTGTLVDSTGAYSSSPADFTVDFSNANNYTISIVTVPEPGTISLVAAGLLGAWIWRRKGQ
jgi:hypothetical protein